MPAGDNALVVKINGDPSDFNAAMAETQAKSKGFASALEEAAKPAAVAFAGLSGAIGYAIKQFADAEQMQAKLNATLEATKFAAGLSATEISNMATALSKVTAYDDEAIIGAQNLLLSFTKIGKEVFPNATKATLDLAAKLQIDLNSAALIVGKALQNPAEGLGALSKAGIRFSEDQKKVIQALVDSGNAAKAQDLILKELATFSLGQAEAQAKTLAGSLSQMKNEFNNVAEVIGAYFSPILAGLTQQLVDFLKYVQQNEELVRFTAVTLGVAAAFTGLITGVGGALFAFQKFMAILPLFNIAITGTTNTIRGLAGATGIGLLIVAISLLIQHWDLVQEKTAGVTFATAALVQQWVAAMTGPLTAIATSIKAAFTGHFDEIVPALQAGLGAVTSFYTETGRKVTQAYADGKAIGQTLLDQRNANMVSAEQKAADEAAHIWQVRHEEELRQFREANDTLIDLENKTVGTMVTTEQGLSDTLIDIYDKMGAGQVSEYQSTSDELIAAANARAAAVAAAEGGAVGGGGGSVSIGSTGTGSTGSGGALGPLLEDSERGRAARRTVEPTAYNPFTGRNDLREYIQNYCRQNGIPFYQGFSGFMSSGAVRDKIPARISPGEIVVPEKFADGIRKGRYSLGGPGRGGSSNVRVDVGFKTREANRILTVDTNRRKRLGINREAT